MVLQVVLAFFIKKKAHFGKVHVAFVISTIYTNLSIICTSTFAEKNHIKSEMYSCDNLMLQKKRKGTAELLSSYKFIQTTHIERIYMTFLYIIYTR